MMKKVCWVLLIILCMVLIGCRSQNNDKPKKEYAPPKERVTVVMGTDVYKRTGPGTNFQPNGFYQHGDRVTIVDSSDPNWVQVENADKSKSWIMYEYLAQYIYGQDKSTPETIILPRRCLGEAMVDILKCEVFPKAEIQLYKYADVSSEIVGTLAAEKKYPVVDYEIHTSLGNEVSFKNKKVRLLAYLGEGIYAYYANGLTHKGDFGTNKLDDGSKAADWIKVKTETGEGWFRYIDHVKDLHAGKPYGIWFPKEK